MSKRTITVRMRSDGTIVRVQNGVERPVSPTPISPMTQEEITASAESDPDNRPLTSTQLRELRRVPRAKTLRRALGLTQEEFAERYQIPLGTLRDWEQGRTAPDKAALAYLKVIAHDPKHVDGALKEREASPKPTSVMSRK